MNKQASRLRARRSRAFRVRNRIRASGTRPRLSVFRSTKHISVQIIDDQTQRTLCSATSVGKKAGVKGGGNVQGAKVVGKKIAEIALGKGIKEVAFDRGPYKYHGRVKALADAAREAGLKF
ncbi:MAG: 50S ribosomal protein L18 [Planctomycetes bacterium]|nr:50S ribosomal protein L18 [Planctomycetota bacterium]